MKPADNPFETGERKVIPAVLVYVQKDNHMLMIHRGPRNGDFHAGKWNGLGGKCEKDESPLQAAEREVFEESALEIHPDRFVSLGVLQFPNFKPHKNEDWIVFVFRANLENGEPKKVSEEGELHWIPKHEVSSLNLWPGDHLFIPYVLKNEPFVGTIWYHDQKVTKSWFQTLKGRSL